jgi:hypothetical protein
MSKTYRFNKPPERTGAQRGALLDPAIPHPFTVLEVIKEPHPSQHNPDNWVIDLKLEVGKEKVWIWDYPWSGTTNDGTERDGIAEFLIACNRAPKPGEVPNWKKVAGGKGMCRIKHEEQTEGKNKGQKRERINYYLAPHQAETSSSPEAATSASSGDFEKARKKQQQSSQGATEPEPDELPY